MSHPTFLIVCAILIAIPFVVSCIKGNLTPGLIAGGVSFVIMGVAAGNGASMFVVHLLGFVIAGFGVAWSLQND